MARVTIEDSLKKGYNKFMIVHLAAKRVIQLKKGKEPLVECDNREIVTALREIEESKVKIRSEVSPSGAHLEMEPELPAPADDQIEPETTIETHEQVGLEPGAGFDAQGETDTFEEDSVEEGFEAQEEDEPEDESNEPGIGEEAEGYKET
jgi:DNA-directed RNA polymerase subunit omega